MIDSIQQRTPRKLRHQATVQPSFARRPCVSIVQRHRLVAQLARQLRIALLTGLLPLQITSSSALTAACAANLLPSTFTILISCCYQRWYFYRFS